MDYLNRRILDCNGDEAYDLCYSVIETLKSSVQDKDYELVNKFVFSAPYFVIAIEKNKQWRRIADYYHQINEHTVSEKYKQLLSGPEFYKKVKALELDSDEKLELLKLFYLLLIMSDIIGENEAIPDEIFDAIDELRTFQIYFTARKKRKYLKYGYLIDVLKDKYHQGYEG